MLLPGRFKLFFKFSTQRMEEMLNGFQSDLSSISTEIQSLQEQSISMNVKLKNRQVWETDTSIVTSLALLF